MNLGILPIISPIIACVLTAIIVCSIKYKKSIFNSKLSVVFIEVTIILMSFLSYISQSSNTTMLNIFAVFIGITGFLGVLLSFMKKVSNEAAIFLMLISISSNFYIAFII